MRVLKSAKVDGNTKMDGVQSSVRNTCTAHSQSQPSQENFVTKISGSSAIVCHVLQCSDDGGKKELTVKAKSNRSHETDTERHGNGTKRFKQAPLPAVKHASFVNQMRGSTNSLHSTMLPINTTRVHKPNKKLCTSRNGGNGWKTFNLFDAE